MENEQTLQGPNKHLSPWSVAAQSNLSDKLQTSSYKTGLTTTHQWIRNRTNGKKYN